VRQAGSADEADESAADAESFVESTNDTEADGRNVETSTPWISRRTDVILG